MMFQKIRVKASSPVSLIAVEVAEMVAVPEVTCTNGGTARVAATVMSTSVCSNLLRIST